VRGELLELRRSLHRIPELAFEEERTAQRILGELEALGISATYGGRGMGGGHDRPRAGGHRSQRHRRRGQLLRRDATLAAGALTNATNAVH